jgi:hypothetical protein
MSNGNLSDETKKYIDLEIENRINKILRDERLTRDGIKSLFSEYTRKMPSDSDFIKALVVEICDRITFREEVANLLGDRVKKMVDEHDENCSFKKEHNIYHLNNEHTWGLLKRIKDNIFAIIWRIFLIVSLLVSFMMSDKIYQFAKEIITKLLK